MRALAAITLVVVLLGLTEAAKQLKQPELLGEGLNTKLGKEVLHFGCICKEKVQLECKVKSGQTSYIKNYIFMKDEKVIATSALVTTYNVEVDTWNSTGVWTCFVEAKSPRINSARSNGMIILAGAPPLGSIIQIDELGKHEAVTSWELGSWGYEDFTEYDMWMRPSNVKFTVVKPDVALPLTTAIHLTDDTVYTMHVRKIRRIDSYVQYGPEEVVSFITNGAERLVSVHLAITFALITLFLNLRC